MTPYELSLYAKVFIRKQLEETKEKIIIGYLNAQWTIQWLGKKSQHPKPLKEILDNIGKEKRIMTDDQMLAQARALNMLFGGEVIG